MDIKIKRVYEKPSASDGKRILIDRLWPRGLSKAEAQVDLWLKEIAPSGELRKWFDHDPAKWNEFRKRYRSELDKNKDAVSQLKSAATGKTTLLYAAKDTEHNNAVVILEYLRN
jgi:uncharacterized protein YeaO (DUF488 family)